MRSWSAHRWFVAAMLFLLATSLATWWATREPLPRTIRVATAMPGGLYEALGRVLAESLEERTGRRVECVPTRGSIENSELLEAGQVDLAILQAPALQRARVTLPDLAVLAPLYPEVVHVIVRSGSPIRSITELPGHAVSLGPVGSGMRESARALLEHYRIEVSEITRSEAFFEELASDPALEAAVVTTGLDNPALRALLDAGDYELLPILDADAIALANPLFEPFVLPRGFCDERPPLPAVATPTVASTAVLAARKDCSAGLVKAALGALYARDLRPDFPHVILEHEALARAPVPVHPDARSVLDPYGGLDTVASFIESLSGLKELAVGLFALVFLVIDQLRRLDRRQRERALRTKKDHLDEFLLRTVRIEQEQMETEDPARLRRYLDDVTRVKLEALQELSEEELRADSSFQIFLLQCANLSRKIQGKLQLLKG